MTKQLFIEYENIKFFWHPWHKEYMASKCGKILSLKCNKKRILKPRNNGNNYLSFYFCNKREKKNYYIHRFVFETFKGEIPKGMHIDHWDFDRENNSINNLRLLSPKENHNKSVCKKVFSLDNETQEEKNFDSIKEAGNFYQIPLSLICANCQEKIKNCKSKKDGKIYQFFYFY